MRPQPFYPVSSISFRLLSRPVLVALLVSLLAPLLPLRAAQAAALEKPRLRLAIGGKIGFFYLPVSVAEGLGYFKDEGLEIEFNDFAGGAKSLQALVGGSADITSGAYEHTIQMKAKNISLKAFDLQGAYADIGLGVLKSKIPKYRSPADLVGKKVGVTAPGSATHFFVMHQLIRAGLKPDSIQAIGIGQGGAAVAAARRGEIDAIASVDPVLTELEMSGVVEVVADVRTPAGSQEVYGGSFPAGCLYTTEKFLAANPRTVQALTNAMVRALVWMKTATPEQILGVLPASFAIGQRDVMLEAIRKTKPSFSVNGQIPREGAENVLRVQAEIDPAVRAAKIDVGSTYDNAFAQKAAERYAK
jgi:NitT/TauT family transport system substrate-binding protein